MASQYMKQTIKITRKQGLSALLDRLFSEEKEEKKKIKSLKDVSLKEQDEDIRDKKQS